MQKDKEEEERRLKAAEGGAGAGDTQTTGGARAGDTQTTGEQDASPPVFFNDVKAGDEVTMTPQWCMPGRDIVVLMEHAGPRHRGTYGECRAATSCCLWCMPGRDRFCGTVVVKGVDHRLYHNHIPRPMSTSQILAHVPLINLWADQRCFPTDNRILRGSL